MNVVERTKRVCRERKIPIHKLEQDLNFSNGYLRQLKKGILPSDRLEQISNYLGLSIDYLAGKTADATADDTAYLIKQVLRDAAKLTPPQLHQKADELEEIKLSRNSDEWVDDCKRNEREVYASLLLWSEYADQIDARLKQLGTDKENDAKRQQLEESYDSCNSWLEFLDGYLKPKAPPATPGSAEKERLVQDITEKLSQLDLEQLRLISQMVIGLQGSSQQ